MSKRTIPEFPQARGKEFWRSLEDLADTPQFREYLEREFQPGILDAANDVSRRRFLQLMAASLGLLGLQACAPPAARIVPYVNPPEGLVPGKALQFATAWTLGGYAQGVLLQSHMGRPTKVEGNPDHPATLGASDALTQASILGLYDPDRSKVVTRGGRISTWDAFGVAIAAELDRQRPRAGEGLRILTETVTSPTQAALLRKLLQQLPKARWHQHEAVGRDSARMGAWHAFGEFVETRYELMDADVVVALGADFLHEGPAAVRLLRQFAARRSLRQNGAAAMNRLYVLETMPSGTGALADHRRAVRPSELEPIARALVAGTSDDPWVKVLLKDLEQHRGRSVVLAGEFTTPAVHALAHALNHKLGNVGKTVFHTEPVEALPTDQAASLRELCSDMDAGRVETLVVLGANPVHTAPADLHFKSAMAKVRFRVHLGLMVDETALQAWWHLPEAHPYESWGDARAFDGTVTLQQPLIAPLYEGRSQIELLTLLLGQGGRTGEELLKEHWLGMRGDTGFASFWKKSLHDGLVAGSAAATKDIKPRSDLLTTLPQLPAGARTGGLELCLRPDPCVWDGRFANNAWLQELPKPMTKLTWENAAHLSPKTAERLGVRSGDVVELSTEDRKVQVPVWILPGHAADTVTLHLGYGRAAAGRVGTGLGSNAYLLRSAQRPWHGFGLAVKKTGAVAELACTQDHHSMEGRDIVRTASVESFLKDPKVLLPHGREAPADLSMHPPFRYDGNAWGMVVDLSVCSGCNACVTACQSENNIPVVGKDQVMRGRELHWMRIDRYWKGDLEVPESFFQPVMCQHCENAPCEIVCPVAATAHSDEGLNDMVYNRCVGTRYCANNCPYKVRRFNFFQYADFATETLKLQRNPEVTTRSRGVMEKCSYCIQRISEKRIEARKEDRPIRDGEIKTACQQACPAQAIVFGDINDQQSAIGRARELRQHYALLGELGVRPRTTYLANLKNPNPEMPPG